MHRIQNIRCVCGAYGISSRAFPLWPLTSTEGPFCIVRKLIFFSDKGKTRPRAKNRNTQTLSYIIGECLQFLEITIFYAERGRHSIIHATLRRRCFNGICPILYIGMEKFSSSDERLFFIFRRVINSVFDVCRLLWCVGTNYLAHRSFWPGFFVVCIDGCK